MKSFLVLFFLLWSLFSQSQNPLVKMWDRRYGGTDLDQAVRFQETTDGGYIIGGISYSGIGGDKSDALWGDWDYWLVKLDSAGNKEWDKDFGGTGTEYLSCLQQTIDGGYILGGSSASMVSGNKTQACWGSWDYWIIKIDPLGNIQWDKDFGGTAADELQFLQQTFDGGYILGGSSNSVISGNKTEDTVGSFDYWIVKIDSIGNKQWDKVYGGLNDDGISSVFQTLDKGFILGGVSNSGVGGNKTQPTWGAEDYWIVKTDSAGNVLWDKDYGGDEYDYPFYMELTGDGGYILGGNSNSGISGNKTQANWDPSGTTSDYWIVKTDSNGNMQWDKDFGGTEMEEYGMISKASNGGFLFTGDSYSQTSGDKAESNLGYEQTWTVKTDSLGNKLWDKTILSPGHDETGMSIQSSDGCYVFVNTRDGGIGGYKTQSPQGSYDYWIIKFCDSTFLPPTATAFTDSFLCPGTCTNFTNLSFNGTSFQWSFPGAIPPISTDVSPANICYPTPGSYDVQLIATNANGSDTLFLANYITVYPSPPPQSITQNGDTLIALAGAASYRWYLNGNIIPGAINYFYVAQSNGDYNVVATDANGCEVEAAIFNVITNSSSIFSGNFISVSPTPVSEKLIINSLKWISQLKIYDVIGKLLLIQIDPGNKIELDVQFLSSGIYFLQLRTEQGFEIKRFVKE